MVIPSIPEGVDWRNGLVLEPAHFQRTDHRSAGLSHLSGLVADPWPWGFTSFTLDETALASSGLRIECEGLFPDGTPFRAASLVHALGAGSDGDALSFHIVRTPEGEVSLHQGEDAPSRSTLPVARLIWRGGAWSGLSDWSPPALLIGSGHPMRLDLNQMLGGLAALGAGFMATLRLPGAEERPAARVLGQVAAALVQGVGVIEALLAAPAVPPGRLGIEALRLALGVRGAAGIFEPLDSAWDPADQRGSVRRLLHAAESAAAGIGLPFRASVFRRTEDPDMLQVDGMPSDALLLAIEASRPADLVAARLWLEGAALAAPDRIQEALTRRVGGCPRRSIARDPRIGVSSGPLLALYHVDHDLAWRGGKGELTLAAKTPPPPNTSFSILVPEGIGETAGTGGAASSHLSGGLSAMSGHAAAMSDPRLGGGAGGFARHGTGGPR